jgi:hypothetical protein
VGVVPPPVFAEATFYIAEGSEIHMQIWWHGFHDFYVAISFLACKEIVDIVRKGMLFHKVGKSVISVQQLIVALKFHQKRLGDGVFLTNTLQRLQQFQVGTVTEAGRLCRSFLWGTK